ncbi:MAG: twin-arginine translocase TatA/TatE family subunit [Myxococcota bacterium]
MPAAVRHQSGTFHAVARRAFPGSGPSRKRPRREASMFGTGEVVLLLVVLVMVFGASRIPQLGEAVGLGLRNFKRSIQALDSGPDEAPLPPPPRHHDAAERV